MSQEEVEDIKKASSWVPCGSHPLPDPSDCTYCAIDVLAAAYRAKCEEVEYRKRVAERRAGNTQRERERAMDAERQRDELAKAIKDCGQFCKSALSAIQAAPTAKEGK